MARFKKIHQDEIIGIRQTLLDWLMERELPFRLFIKCCNETKLSREHWYDTMIVDGHYNLWQKLKLV